MNKITAALIIVIALTAITAPYTMIQASSEETSINDSIQNVKAKQINYAKSIFWNDTLFIEQYDVIYFVNVSGDPTYTFSQREFIDVNLDMNKMNKFNDSVELAIQQKAKDLWNYTLPVSKISYHAYTKGS